MSVEILGDSNGLDSKTPENEKLHDIHRENSAIANNFYKYINTMVMGGGVWTVAVGKNEK